MHCECEWKGLRVGTVEKLECSILVAIGKNDLDTVARNDNDYGGNCDHHGTKVWCGVFHKSVSSRGAHVLSGKCPIKMVCQMLEGVCFFYYFYFSIYREYN